MQECRFFAKGGCLRGSQCPFVHVGAEMPQYPQAIFYPPQETIFYQPPPNEYFNGPPLCKFFQQGNCARGSTCRFVHQKLQKTNHSRRDHQAPIVDTEPRFDCSLFN